MRLRPAFVGGVIVVATPTVPASALTPGGRYVFTANRRWFGPLSLRLCSGYAIETAKASELKAWLASLPQPEPTKRP